MSYQLNKTNGDLLTDLIDGQIDTSSTNLVLVGRNYTGYGEYFNENFIKLLENFANTAAPASPLEGQLWWDTLDDRLKVWDGAQWKASGGPFVQSERPTMVAGDLWIDNLNKQLYFFDGNEANELTLVGPGYNSFQEPTGFVVKSILDQQSRSRPVAEVRVKNELIYVISNETFTPTYAERILELVNDTNPDGTIYTGINVVDQTLFKFRGTASSSEALVDQTGAVRTANQFLPSDSNGITVGTLTIQNLGGLTIGTSQNNVQKIIGDKFFIENQLTDNDISLRVKSSAFESLITDALYIDAENARVGIFNNAPDAMLHVGSADNPVGVSNKDVIIEGNLIVRGDYSTVDVSTLRVADKNIELAISEDSTLLEPADIDDAGIIVKATGTDKKLTWKNSNEAWTSTEHFDLAVGKNYRIDNDIVLTQSALGTVITDALGLLRIGTLQYLNVDNINLNGSSITTTLPLGINSAGTITVNNQKITGVAEPTLSTDVTTKNYVDTSIASQTLTLTLDTTGLTDNQIKFILESVYPAADREEGTIGYIITLTTAGSTAENIDVDAVKNVSFVAVDSNGTQNESVVQDIAFFPAAGTVNVSVTRGLKRFEVESGSWTFKTTVYSDYTSAIGWP